MARLEADSERELPSVMTEDGSVKQSGERSVVSDEEEDGELIGKNSIVMKKEKKKDTQSRIIRRLKKRLIVLQEFEQECELLEEELDETRKERDEWKKECVKKDSVISWLKDELQRMKTENESKDVMINEYRNEINDLKKHIPDLIKYDESIKQENRLNTMNSTTLSPSSFSSTPKCIIVDRHPVILDHSMNHPRIWPHCEWTMPNLTETDQNGDPLFLVNLLEFAKSKDPAKLSVSKHLFLNRSRKIKADANLKSNGTNALHICAIFPDLSDTLRWWLKDGHIDPNRGTDPDGWAPVHIAVLKGNEQGARVLLNDRRVSPDQKNSAGHTALMMAALKNHAEIAALLIKHGCNQVGVFVDSYEWKMGYPPY